MGDGNRDRYVARKFCSMNCSDLSLTFIIADFGSKEERFIIGVEHAIPYGKLVL